MRWAIAGFTLFIAAGAHAEEPEEFCADRPGLATGTCIAAPRTFQLESSLVEWSHSSGEKELVLGSSRLRYGFDRRTDLQLAIAPYIRSHEGGPGSSTEHGTGDLTVAIKHVVSPSAGPVSVALFPYVTLPTAPRPIGNRAWAGGLLVPIEIPLSGSSSLTLTPEFDWNADGEGGGHRGRYGIASSLGFDLSKRWSVSIDGLVARQRDEGSTGREASAAVALAFLAAPTVQLDVQANLGLAPGTPNIQLISGIAFRF